MSFYDPLSHEHDALPKPPKANTAWMMTVADLFSLMLTFFVLLYSMSVIQQDEWEQISESLFQRIKPPTEETVFTLPALISIDRIKIKPAKNLDYLQKVITEQLGDLSSMQGVRVRKERDYIAISLTGDVMFAPGGTALLSDAEKIVHQLGEFLSRVGNEITIEGHTDPSPIHSSSFPSNWELSMGRAITVANTLREVGYPYKVDVLGLGNSRYAAASGAASREESYALARRVDIIVRESVAKY